MTLPTVSFDLHPMDVHNLCFVLRRYKEKSGPRSLRYILKPGQPVQVVFEPWNRVVTFPRSPYLGDKEHEIRVWGRRRLFILERLIQLARKFTVHLLGSGLPSFYIADLGHMNFTLGLSGWTANDWARGSNLDGHFARYTAHASAVDAVARILAARHVAPMAALTAAVPEPRETVLAALFELARRGQVAFDYAIDAYRWRPILDAALTASRKRSGSTSSPSNATGSRATLVANRRPAPPASSRSPEPPW